jgi:pentatricopeptide repeat protein
VLTALIDAGAQCADADAAWRAFAAGGDSGVPLGAHEPALCAMLCAFARAKQPDRALRFFESIRREWPRGRPPDVCYLLLRDAAAAAGDVPTAKAVAAMMQAELPRRKPGKPSAADAAEAPAQPRSSRRVSAVATFSANGQEWRTANGEAEAELDADAPARALLAGAGPALLAALGDAYTPDTSCVLLMAGGESAQRSELACHAEKKALGALLLRADADSSADASKMPRVRVSIRMCRDCHAAFAAASATWGRALACDDGHAHVFVDGLCSCGNRWR